MFFALSQRKIATFVSLGPAILARNDDLVYFVRSAYLTKNLQGDTSLAKYSAHTKETRLNIILDKQIPPTGVVFLDKVEFVLSAPILDLLFAGYGCCDIGKFFIINQFGELIAGAEAIEPFRAMFTNAIEQVGGYTGIQYRMIFIGNDIYIAVIHSSNIGFLCKTTNIAGH